MKSRIFFVIILFSLQGKAQQWRDVGGGINGLVEILKGDSIANKLYAGGQFAEAGGVPANNIAFWDGFSWHCVGTNSVFKGVGHYIDAITFYNGDLIVAGRFDSIDNIAANSIARWDGTAWSNLGNGFQEAGASVKALEIYNGELYAGGDFNWTTGDTLRNIAKWTSNGWIKLLGGLDDYVTSMKVYHNKLIVGGVFGSAFLNDSTNFLAPHMIAWDGNTWSFFGGNLQDNSYDLEILHDTLFSCGQSSIKYFDGSSWQNIPHPSGGTQPWIVNMNVYQGELYVCGFFTNPPDIGRYNGLSYDSICSVNGFIEQLEVFQGELYIAGGFNELNGNALNSIARYNPGNFIEYISSNQNIVIYPNPFLKGSDQIFTVAGIDVDSMTISTVTGELVLSSRLNLIDLSNLNEGVYLVTVVAKNEKKKYSKILIII